MAMESSELSVYKSNEIIKARYNLTVREQKFLLYLVSIIDRQKEQKKELEIFNTYEIKVTDVEKVINITGKKWGSIYETVSEIVLSLQENPLVIIKPNGNVKKIFWCDSIEFVNNKILRRVQEQYCSNSLV